MTTTPDPAIVAFLLDDADLHLSAGYTNGYDPANPLCALCGEHEAAGVVFGIVVPALKGRLCAECAERTGPLGEAFVDLIDGLETIASAARDPERRTAILDLASRGLRWIQDADEAEGVE